MAEIPLTSPGISKLITVNSNKTQNFNCNDQPSNATNKPLQVDTKPTAFLYKGPMMNLSTSTEGMYGEISENGIKLIADQMYEFGLDENSVILDLGSGRGAPSIVFAHYYKVFSSIGIEKCEQAFINCMTNVKILIDREKNRFLQDDLSPLHCYPCRSIAFANEDLASYENFKGATHLYSFDAAMEGQLINNMVYQFFTSTTTWLYASFHHDLISTFGLKGCQIVRKIPVNMTGSGEGRTVYIYLKDDWKKIKEFSKKFLLEYVMGEAFKDGIVLPSKKLKLSKWMQPLTVLDLIYLSKAPLSKQELWTNSFFDKYSLGILTRSQKTKLWGSQKSEYKKNISKSDKILEEIAKCKTPKALISARKRLQDIQRKRSSDYIEFHFEAMKPGSNLASSHDKTLDQAPNGTSTDNHSIKSADSGFNTNNQSKPRKHNHKTSSSNCTNCPNSYTKLNKSLQKPALNVQKNHINRMLCEVKKSSSVKL